MIESRLLKRIEQKKARLDALRPLPSTAVGKLKEQLTIEWIYHSNAIEGSTLTLRETQLILETGLTIGGKSLREHFEVINHKEAIEYVEALVSQDIKPTPFHARQLHALVMAKVDDENAGSYRTLPVRIGGSTFDPPEAWLVPQQMEAWGQWLQGEASELHPVERAALAHHRFVAIHPFLDGNGRTGRLLMNLLLMRDGYPPTVILTTTRQHYYRVLAEADRGRDRALVNLVARAVERSLTLFLDACTPQQSERLPDEQWILLREAAAGTAYSQAYLSLLARKGRLEAIKRGRNWYTTRQAVEQYQQSVQETR